jgi:glycerol-3-phosphate cytidylyltransferase-like family protein/ubiquinone/menaquinone biosynthesis C-methylase UbiE
MIISFNELLQHRHAVTMVVGGFDPLHDGHIAYFQAAADLGLPLLCNLTGDEYVSDKHQVLLPLAARARVIDALRPIDLVHPNAFDTEAVLRELRPRFYAKGADWRDHLPQEQIDICRQHGIDIVYLDTQKNSSSGLLEAFKLAADDLAGQISRFQDLVQNQAHIDQQSYSADYFFDGWRDHQNNYSLEARRRLEGRNPKLIKQVFRPKKVLDMGCGPGALMYLLDEIGISADGIDLSPYSRDLAPPQVAPRIMQGSVTDIDLPADSYDLVICREVLEHLSILQVQQAVQNLCRISACFVYVTTRFHPEPAGLFQVTDEPEVDPTHITLMHKQMLRLMFVLQGMRRRADLEQRMDWLNKNRVLVYEKPGATAVQQR